jgi:hypothetical protein
VSGVGGWVGRALVAPGVGGQGARGLPPAPQLIQYFILRYRSARSAKRF